eukprot:scaffold5795_cov165-Amphora_coffeaeformis.AAC.4
MAESFIFVVESLDSENPMEKMPKLQENVLFADICCARPVTGGVEHHPQKIGKKSLHGIFVCKQCAASKRMSAICTKDVLNQGYAQVLHKDINIQQSLRER